MVWEREGEKEGVVMSMYRAEESLVDIWALNHKKGVIYKEAKYSFGAWVVIYEINVGFGLNFYVCSQNMTRFLNYRDA